MRIELKIVRRLEAPAKISRPACRLVPLRTNHARAASCRCDAMQCTMSTPACKGLHVCSLWQACLLLERSTVPARRPETRASDQRTSVNWCNPRDVSSGVCSLFADAWTLAWSQSVRVFQHMPVLQAQQQQEHARQLERHQNACSPIPQVHIYDVSSLSWQGCKAECLPDLQVACTNQFHQPHIRINISQHCQATATIAETGDIVEVMRTHFTVLDAHFLASDG